MIRRFSLRLASVVALGILLFVLALPLVQVGRGRRDDGLTGDSDYSAGAGVRRRQALEELALAATRCRGNRRKGC